MRVVSDFPYDVVEQRHTWIEMPDGVRLAARIWRPTGSEQEPVPAILEFIPYRQNDLTAQRDSVHHPYLAGHGYAAVRVDLRGSGNSEGVLHDEYLPQELDDAEAVLAWLSQQPWCDGTTGMMGISWGGFNALQVAARRPPGLEAIVSVSSSDDRYSDDVHYMGGCLLGDNLSWASTMFAYNACPPDPAVVGDRWREMWLDRLDGSGLWLETWLRHQRRDDYWRHGSIREDYSAIRCPVMAVSGWADGYSNAVFRLLAHLEVPRMGLIGPWSHKYPHLGVPGPAIGFLQEVVRWWDRWLKGRDNGIDEAPRLRAWMQDSVPPHTAYKKRPGRWVGEPDWPSPHVKHVEYPLARNRIGAPGESVADVTVGVESPLSVGQFAGKWCSYNAPPDLPYDQREEDGGSLVFESAPLTDELDILGAPLVHLELRADRPNAMVAVRLSDVAPDGAATRVSYGLLNLTHRDGHADPQPLEPDTTYRVRVALNGVAHSFDEGHRMRVSISTSYWPLAWPPPQPVRLDIDAGASSLVIPVRPRTEDDGEIPPFEEPEGAERVAATQVLPQEHAWLVSRDLVDYSSKLEVVKDLGTVRFEDIDLDVRRRAYERYSSVADDLDTVKGETDWIMAFHRGDWDVHVDTRTTLESNATEFVLHAELDAFEGDRRVRSLNWSTRIPRDGV
jgi:putative CocE/NonD family hydrolase